MPESTDATDVANQAERHASWRTHLTASVLRPTAGGHSTMFSEAMRTAYDTTSTLLQPSRLDVSLRLIEVAREGSREVLDLWIGTTQQTQRAALEIWGVWAGRVERLLEMSTPTIERVPDQITREAEYIAEDTEAATGQRDAQRAQQERVREHHEHERRQTLLPQDDHHLGGTAIIATATISGYCMKCKAPREVKDAKQIMMKNGRPATEGTCPVCNTKIFKIGAIR